MKRKISIIIFIIIVIVMAIIIIYNSNKVSVPDNYIAVFIGNNKTYFYKIDNEQDNYGYKYISVRSNKIIDKGDLDWMDDFFTIAKDNDAYSKVNYKGKEYTIEKFRELCLKN